MKYTWQLVYIFLTAIHQYFIFIACKITILKGILRIFVQIFAMMKIQMVDLHGQYVKIKGEIDLAIQHVIDNSNFINGPEVQEFKKQLSGYQHCRYTIPCANGTDALQIALMALPLKPGDEVLVPDFTFIATAEVIALLGLKPVFIDVDPDTFLLDINKLKDSITNRSRVIVPVHLYGQCTNMDEIMAIAKKFNLWVVEDNAQALGADIHYGKSWHKSGTVGHIGCTSFFPSKNLGCYGDGGAIFTNDESLAATMASIANHGAKVKYYHEMVGINSRLDTLQAAILLVKLKKLDEYNSARQKAAGIYDNLLKDLAYVQIPKRAKNSTHVFHQYTLKAENRDKLKDYLVKKGIPTMIYYPVPMHNQKPYITKGDFTISEQLCEQVISLPMHTELQIDEQEFIAESIKSFYKEN